MRVIQTRGTTPRQIRARVLAMLKAQAQGAEVSVRWTHRLRWVVYPTGARGYHGQFEASAPGFRPRRMIVDADAAGILIR